MEYDDVHQLDGIFDFFIIGDLFLVIIPIVALCKQFYHSIFETEDGKVQPFNFQFYRFISHFFDFYLKKTPFFVFDFYSN